MNRFLLALAVLIAAALLAQSASMVSLSGQEGSEILGRLTNNSSSNASLNLSENSSFLLIGGEDGNSLMRDLANNTENLSDWGGKPSKIPVPPTYDPRGAQTYAILRANHGL